ncbi:helix-turn-helix domain-containing protein [[Clostridium] innocuum]|nr:helix-turn-helix domain-containing protein [[Clostridium] innocuum]
MSYLDYEFYKYIGIKLKDARTKHKYSLEEVGKRIGKTKKTIQRYETGEVRIDIGTLDSLCNVLDLDCDELLKQARINSIESDNNHSISTIEDAAKIFIEHPQVAAFGGYDIEKMSDEEKIEFANQILDSIKFFASKYKK